MSRTKWAAFFGATAIVVPIALIAFIRLMDLLYINGYLLLFLGLIVFTLFWSYDALTEPKKQQ